MKAALDITVLYVAEAGVFYYRYNLVRALLELPTHHEFTLLDYFPLEGGWARREPDEVKSLLEGRANVRRIRGLKDRKLARLGFVQKYGLLPLVRPVDRLLEMPWQCLCRFETDRRIRRHLGDVDLFHSSDVLYHALRGAKNVATIYDLTALLFPEYHTARVRQAQAKKYRFVQHKADAVITISESARRDAIEYLKLDPDRVFVIYGGVDPAYRPLPQGFVAMALGTWGLAPQSYILHLGTIEPRKNLVCLIQAYHRLKKSMPNAPKLVQVGTKGWLCDDVFEQVHHLDLEDSVTFLGRIESHWLPALYNGARLFVYPSIYEGFGLPPLEAMACGVPVITSNTSSLPEVVGDAGVMVDPCDVPQLAEVMERLLVDEQESARLGQRGLERARRFTWQTTARETVRIYEKLIG